MSGSARGGRGASRSARRRRGDAARCMQEGWIFRHCARPAPFPGAASRPDGGAVRDDRARHGGRRARPARCAPRPVPGRGPRRHGVLRGPRATAAIGAVAVLAQVVVAAVRGSVTDLNHTFQIITLILISVFVTLFAHLREVHEKELVQLRSVAEAAQQVVLRPLRERLGPLRRRERVPGRGSRRADRRGPVRRRPHRPRHPAHHRRRTRARGWRRSGTRRSSSARSGPPPTRRPTSRAGRLPRTGGRAGPGPSPGAGRDTDPTSHAPSETGRGLHHRGPARHPRPRPGASSS